MAVIDSGITPDHSEFGDRIVDAVNFYTNADSPIDQHGHGTHVASTIAGATIGVAPAAPVPPSTRAPAPAPLTRLPSAANRDAPMPTSRLLLLSDSAASSPITVAGAAAFLSEREYTGLVVNAWPAAALTRGI